MESTIEDIFLNDWLIVIRIVIIVGCYYSQMTTIICNYWHCYFWNGSGINNHLQILVKFIQLFKENDSFYHVIK